jgi:ABC-type multidrug transport system fused ATPase/permease subunit
MGLKDQRIKIINEVLSGIKVIKLYAWEQSFLTTITDIRRQELLYLKKAAYLSAILTFLAYSAPFLVSVAAFATYSLTGNNLTPQKAFVSLALLNIIRFPISILPSIISKMVQSHVALKRITNFLQNEELDPNALKQMTDSEVAVAVKDGTFRWEKGERVILQNIDLTVQKGSLVGVVGIVGSGKSSLLSALLGEMEHDCGQVAIQGSVAYVGQVAWIQNAPLKNNILFNSDLDEERYQQAIAACCLNPDLEQLPARDMTEIGEKANESSKQS